MAEDNTACYCCAGLALGYLLFHSESKANTITSPTEKQTIESIINKDLPNTTTENHSKTQSFLLDKIKYYQTNIGPQMKKDLGVENICKYKPSCSEYAKQAVEKYGAAKGSILAASRLARCNPLSKGGNDPLV